MRSTIGKLTSVEFGPWSEDDEKLGVNGLSVVSVTVLVISADVLAISAAIFGVSVTRLGSTITVLSASAIIYLTLVIFGMAFVVS